MLSELISRHHKTYRFQGEKNMINSDMLNIRNKICQGYLNANSRSLTFTCHITLSWNPRKCVYWEINNPAWTEVCLRSITGVILKLRGVKFRKITGEISKFDVLPRLNWIVEYILKRWKIYFFSLESHFRCLIFTGESSGMDSTEVPRQGVARMFQRK